MRNSSERPDEAEGRNEEWILHAISSGNVTRVRDLLLVGETEKKELSPEELADGVKSLSEKGKIELRTVPPSFDNFTRFLLAFSWSWAFWLLAGSTLLMVAAVYGLPEAMPWLGIRWLATGAFLLFAPGFGLVQVMFVPKSDFGVLERIAFSVGLSLVLVSAVGLLLGFSPSGIRLDNIVLSLGGLVLLLAFISASRQYSYLRKLGKRQQTVPY